MASVAVLSCGWRGEQDVPGQEKAYGKETGACEVREMCSELLEVVVI